MLFLINPKITASVNPVLGNEKPEKFLRDDLKSPAPGPSTSNKFRDIFPLTIPPLQRP